MLLKNVSLKTAYLSLALQQIILPPCINKSKDKDTIEGTL